MSWKLLIAPKCDDSPRAAERDVPHKSADDYVRISMNASSVLCLALDRTDTPRQEACAI